MKFTVLSSGSKGNLTYITDGNTSFLIDFGVSTKRAKELLGLNNISIESIDGIFITHEHGDHTRGLQVLLKRHSIPIYTTNETYEVIKKHNIEKNNIVLLNKNEWHNHNEIEILTLDLSHDATDPIGFVIKKGNKRVIYITDTGYLHTKHYEHITNADAYIFESNHDVEMLRNSRYPWSVKRRILSDDGHLSNEDAAHHLKNIIGENTRYIVLAHLSQENNHPDIAYDVLIDTLNSYDKNHEEIKITVAKQHEPTDMFHL